jgi:hypothetical protein
VISVPPEYPQMSKSSLDYSATMRITKMCTLTDAAERLGIPESRMHRWAERRKVTGFPEPVYVHKRTSIYDFVQVDDWVSIWYSTRRRNG